MTTPAPDPRFPDRPDHPDFWRLSRAVIANDTLADKGMPIEAILVSRGLDNIESLRYMAEQRVLRAFGHNFISTDAKALMVSLYMDAFAAALGYVQERAIEEGK